MYLLIQIILQINKILNTKIKIEELQETKAEKEAFEPRYQNRKHVIFVAYEEKEPIGYLIAYDPEDREHCFYCWMAGVEKAYRKRGALTQMMQSLENWMQENGYTKMTIKTRNNKREMLSYLVHHGFDFTQVEKRENPKENRIYLEKEINKGEI